MKQSWIVWILLTVTPAVSQILPGGLGSTLKVMAFARHLGRPALLGLPGPNRLT